MKKLLSTTAMLTSIAFASSAYAAEVYEWTVDGVTVLLQNMKPL